MCPLETARSSLPRGTGRGRSMGKSSSQAITASPSCMPSSPSASYLIPISMKGIIFSTSSTSKASSSESPATCGRGTVVTGRVEQGTIKTGEDVEILGLSESGPLKTTVTGGEMFKKMLDQGEARDNVGLLRGLKRGDVRGQVVCKPGSVKTYTKFEAEIYVLTKY